MRRVFGMSFGLVAALSLAACLVPEKFEASVRVQPDGAYTYKYDGTAVHVFAAAAIKENGRLPKNDEAAIQREVENSTKAPGVKKMVYTGDGRFDVHIEQNLKAGEQVKILKIFNITRDKDGVFTIGPPAMKQQERAQLMSVGIKVSGKAEVFLPGNATVLSHNASGTPGFFSKSYSWDIGGVDSQPLIKFKLSP
jgi:hypothetical protein